MKVALASIFTAFAAICLMVAWSTLAKDGSAPSSASKVKAPSFTMPALGAIPSTEGLTATQAEKPPVEPTLTPASATFSVVKVQHAKSFVRSGDSVLPVGGAITAINLAGKPPTTQKFATAIRVKSPQKSNVPIQVEIVDARGEIALSAAGEVNFRAVKGHETDYLVDWDPVPWRMGGDFQVQVRVAGQPMGTWPLQVVEPKQ